MKKIVCEKCNKVLLEANIIEGTISKSCPKCKHKNVIVVEKKQVSKT